MIVSQYPCERQLLLQFRCALYSFFSILVKTKKKLEFFNQIFFSNFLFLFSDRKKIRILGCIDFPKNKKKKGRWLKWFQVPNIPRVPQLIGTGMVLGLVPYHFAPQVLYGVHIGPFWRTPSSSNHSWTAILLWMEDRSWTNGIRSSVPNLAQAVGMRISSRIFIYFWAVSRPSIRVIAPAPLHENQAQTGTDVLPERLMDFVCPGWNRVPFTRYTYERPHSWDLFPIILFMINNLKMN